MATVRYIVSDVDAAVAFYTTLLDFDLDEQYGPAMAIVHRSDLTLWLAGSTSSAARPMPDGRVPESGGWNRFVVEMDDLAAAVEQLQAAGVSFRNEIVTGPGRSNIMSTTTRFVSSFASIL